MTKMDWLEEQQHQEAAGRQADAIIARLGMTAPVDPLKIARTEYPLLRAGGSNLGSRYDGKLEFHRSRNVFVLFYNTKYDTGLPEGTHHPRTRFSISHELGHFFLEHHHKGLRHGGKSHRSQSEFRSLQRLEREADAFAASLLLPTPLVKPMVNERQLSLSCIDEIAQHFNTSIVSTAIRSVRLSHFPCAIAGIRDGAVAWMFPSESLIEAGIYPNRGILPTNAIEPWSGAHSGFEDRSEGEGNVADWFRTFDREDLDEIYVTEEYHPVPIMGTLLVLLTLDEEDLIEDADDADEPEESDD